MPVMFVHVPVFPLGLDCHFRMQELTPPVVEELRVTLAFEAKVPAPERLMLGWGETLTKNAAE